MSFYLVSEGLTCLSMFSGAYESLKVLAHAEKGADVAALSSILEFWLVLGALTVFEHSVEFLVSWIPFYYFAKCVLLGLVLMPNAKIPHVVYHGLIEPTIDQAQMLVHAHVVPLAEALAIRHGRWFHDQLLSRSLALLDERELHELERELQDKLHEIRTEVRRRHGAEETKGDQK